MKYRKKPVTVEAVQWWKMGDHPDVYASNCAPGSGYVNSDSQNPDGQMVDPGDWIVTHDGRYSVVSAEEFAREYEPVGEYEREITP